MYWLMNHNAGGNWVCRDCGKPHYNRPGLVCCHCFGEVVDERTLGNEAMARQKAEMATLLATIGPKK